MTLLLNTKLTTLIINLNGQSLLLFSYSDLDNNKKYQQIKRGIKSEI